jgi:hypothetical protein
LDCLVVLGKGVYEFGNFLLFLHELGDLLIILLSKDLYIHRSEFLLLFLTDTHEVLGLGSQHLDLIALRVHLGLQLKDLTLEFCNIEIVRTPVLVALVSRGDRFL